MTQPPQSTKKTDAGRIGGPAPVPLGVEMRLRFQLANQKIATCTLHAQNQGSFLASGTMANTLFDAFKTSWQSNLASLMASTTLFIGILLRQMDDPQSPEYASTTTQVAGSGGATAMPQDVALVLTEDLLARGRGAKGRIYVPGWSTVADAGTGQATTAARDALTAWGTGLSTAMQTNGILHAVAKPARREYIGTSGTVHAERQATTILCSAYICKNTEWDTQRRRGV
jgi:hypothetical protein